MEKLPRSIKLSELKKRLKQGGVTLKSWEQPRCKGIHRLHQEVQAGIVDIVMYTGTEGAIQAECHVKSVVIDVCCLSGEEEFRMLKEKHRLVGRTEKQARSKHSVSGKIRPEPEEHAQDAAARCLREKLRLKGRIGFANIREGESPMDAAARIRNGHKEQHAYSHVLVKLFIYDVEEPDPESYPGLLTLRENHYFLCLSTQGNLGNQEMYVRQYQKKRTTYEWVRIGSEKVRELSSPFISR